jgi:hypothetical protein
MLSLSGMSIYNNVPYIFFSVVDPDPHSFGSSGPVSRIRIKIADPDPGARKLTKINLISTLLLRLLFLRRYVYDLSAT